MIIYVVNLRDTANAIFRANVLSVEDFSWTSSMRFYPIISTVNEMYFYNYNARSAIEYRAAFSS
jgi:hypothetical protein